MARPTLVTQPWYVGKGSGVATSGTTVAATPHADTAVGDLMVALLVVYTATQPTITPPSGWTQEKASGTINPWGFVLTKVATSGDLSASATFTSSETITNAGVSIVTVSNATAINATDTTCATSLSASTTESLYNSASDQGEWEITALLGHYNGTTQNLWVLNNTSNYTYGQHGFGDDDYIGTSTWSSVISLWPRVHSVQNSIALQRPGSGTLYSVKFNVVLAKASTEDIYYETTAELTQDSDLLRAQHFMTVTNQGVIWMGNLNTANLVRLWYSTDKGVTWNDGTPTWTTQPYGTPNVGYGSMHQLTAVDDLLIFTAHIGNGDDGRIWVLQMNGTHTGTTAETSLTFNTLNQTRRVSFDVVVDPTAVHDYRIMMLYDNMYYDGADTTYYLYAKELWVDTGTLGINAYTAPLLLVGGSNGANQGSRNMGGTVFYQKTDGLAGTTASSNPPIADAFWLHLNAVQATQCRAATLQYSAGSVSKGTELQWDSTGDNILVNVMKLPSGDYLYGVDALTDPCWIVSSDLTSVGTPITLTVPSELSSYAWTTVPADGMVFVNGPNEAPLILATVDQTDPSWLLRRGTTDDGCFVFLFDEDTEDISDWAMMYNWQNADRQNWGASRWLPASTSAGLDTTTHMPFRINGDGNAAIANNGNSISFEFLSAIVAGINYGAVAGSLYGWGILL